MALAQADTPTSILFPPLGTKKIEQQYALWRYPPPSLNSRINDMESIGRPKQCVQRPGSLFDWQSGNSPILHDSSLNADRGEKS